MMRLAPTLIALALIFPQEARASKGERMTWGVISAVSAVLVGAWSVGQWSEAGSLGGKADAAVRRANASDLASCPTAECKDIDNKGKQATTAALIGTVGTLFLTGISIHQFNKASRTYGLLDWEQSKLALHLPDVRHDFAIGRTETLFFRGTF